MVGTTRYKDRHRLPLLVGWWEVPKSRDGFPSSAFDSSFGCGGGAAFKKQSLAESSRRGWVNKKPYSKGE
jgi:hypothetical protein